MIEECQESSMQDNVEVGLLVLYVGIVAMFLENQLNKLQLSFSIFTKSQLVTQAYKKDGTGEERKKENTKTKEENISVFHS